MFDRYSRSYSSSTNVSVNVEAADAADAARLLKEIEEQALENLRRALPLSNNLAKCTIFEVMDVGGRGAMAAFEINGKRLSAKVVDDFFGNKSEMLIKLFEEMARVIAAELLRDAMKELPAYSEIFR